jgi:hypothetical protein
VARKIYTFMLQHPRDFYSPKEIAASLGLNPKTVSKECWRMARATYGGDVPPVIRCKGGLYRVFRQTDIVRAIEQPKPKAHAIQAKCALPFNRGWGASGVPERTWGSVSSRPLWEFDESNGQYIRTEEWRGRRVVVQVTARTGTILASLECSRNPIDPHDFMAWCEWLDTWTRAQGLHWSERHSSLVNIEFNLDYRELALKELRGLRLKKFRNAWLQAYQKGDFLRFEVRWSPSKDDELTLREAATILQSLTAPAREVPVKLPDPWDGEVA